MTKDNPMADDLAASWFKKKPGFAEKPRRRRDITPARTKVSEPREKPVTFAELDEAHNRIRAIYGPQEEYETRVSGEAASQRSNSQREGE